MWRQDDLQALHKLCHPIHVAWEAENLARYDFVNKVFSILFPFYKLDTSCNNPSLLTPEVKNCSQREEMKIPKK